jgi:iron(III) transport system substrate-binding protein
MRRSLALVLAVLLCGSCNDSPRRPVPAGYPAAYARQIEEAEREGEIVILSAIDTNKVSTLLADFRRLYPRIRLRYVESSAQQVYEQAREEARRGRGTADLLWSSGMDLQIKLVNDGLTQRYVSPERDHIPRWGNWKNQAWATTAEPITFVYNRDLVPDSEMPKGHAALIHYLEAHPAPTRIRLATYSLPQSAVGYLYITQDEQASHDIWRLVRAMGQNGALFFSHAEEILAAVASGRAAIGYNIIGSYALGQVQRNPKLGMVFPRDYTLLMSRIAVIPAQARHPNAAKVFLDFLLSRRGQSHLVEQDMPSIRDDISGPAELAPSGIPVRAIRVGPSLLVTQDKLTRAYFMRKWTGALQTADRENGRSEREAPE